MTRDLPRSLPAFTHTDSRGRLMEIAEWDSNGHVNVKMSVSKAGVLRGLHYQEAPFAQAKIIRVCAGAIRDVAIDLSNGDLYEASLSAEDANSLYIPAGFAHGFKAERDGTVVVYLSTNRYDAASERAFSPLLAGYSSFSWAADPTVLIISSKDSSAPQLPVFEDARHLRMVDRDWVLVEGAQ